MAPAVPKEVIAKFAEHGCKLIKNYILWIFIKKLIEKIYIKKISLVELTKKLIFLIKHLLNNFYFSRWGLGYRRVEPLPREEPIWQDRQGRCDDQAQGGRCCSIPKRHPRERRRGPLPSLRPRGEGRGRLCCRRTRTCRSLLLPNRNPSSALFLVSFNLVLVF